MNVRKRVAPSSSTSVIESILSVPKNVVIYGLKGAAFGVATGGLVGAQTSHFLGHSVLEGSVVGAIPCAIVGGVGGAVYGLAKNILPFKLSDLSFADDSFSTRIVRGASLGGIITQSAVLMLNYTFPYSKPLIDMVPYVAIFGMQGAVAGTLIGTTIAPMLSSSSKQQDDKLAAKALVQSKKQKHKAKKNRISDEAMADSVFGHRLNLHHGR